MYDYPDYEDFYEPAEFEEQIKELMNSLKKTISEEWINKMNALEQENAELQEVKKNFDSIAMDYMRKMRECEIKAESAIRDAESNARRSRLKTLIQDVQYEFFKVVPKYKYGKKCDKCDEKRLIHYKTPSGREETEACECAHRIEILVPQSMIICELSLANKYSERISAWFTPKEYANDDDSSLCYSDYFNDRIVVDDDMDVKDIDSIPENKDKKGKNLYFRTKEKCQEYCNWYSENVLGVKVEELFDE
jgi:ubiquitin